MELQPLQFDDWTCVSKDQVIAMINWLKLRFSKIYKYETYQLSIIFKNIEDATPDIKTILLEEVLSNEFAQKKQV